MIHDNYAIYIREWGPDDPHYWETFYGASSIWAENHHSATWNAKTPPDGSRYESFLVDLKNGRIVMTIGGDWDESDD